MMILQQTRGVLSSGIKDLDALAYIAAVETSGYSMTAVQRKSVDLFIRFEKTANRWNTHQRIYLPIWGNASANSVCLKTRTNGIFIGGVFQGSGFVQGNGSSGYFQGPALNTLSISPTSIGVHLLISQADTTSMPGYVGGFTSASRLLNVEFQGSPERIRFDAYQGSTVATAILSKSTQNGILSFVRDAGNVRISRRISSGATLRTNSAIATGGTVPSAQIKFMVGEYLGLYGFSNARWGSWAISSAMTETQTNEFTLNLKTLWETCTGLTLP